MGAKEAKQKKHKQAFKKMPSTGDKIVYAWVGMEKHKATKFALESELMEDEGKWKIVQHTLCDGSVIKQRIVADNLVKAGGWWDSFKEKRDKKIPFEPKGAAPAAKGKAKAEKAVPAAKAEKAVKGFLSTKGKEPENVWVPKARYDELLKIEADYKASLQLAVVPRLEVAEVLDEEESEAEAEEAKEESSDEEEAEESAESSPAPAAGPRWTYTVTKKGSMWAFYVKDNLKSADMTDTYSVDRTKKGANERARAAIAAFEAKELIKQKKNSVF